MKRPAKPAEAEDRYHYKGPLRTVDGKLPSGSPCHHSWSLSQGEPHYPFGEWGYGARNLSNWTDFTITLIELNNGKWTARPVAGDANWGVHSRQFEDRTSALRAAVACVVRRARRRCRAVDGPELWEKIPPYYKLSHELAQDLIAWATGLLALPAPMLLKVMPPIAVEPAAAAPQAGTQPMLPGMEVRHAP